MNPFTPFSPKPFNPFGPKPFDPFSPAKPFNPYPKTGPSPWLDIKNTICKTAAERFIEKHTDRQGIFRSDAQLSIERSCDRDGVFRPYLATKELLRHRPKRFPKRRSLASARRWHSRLHGSIESGPQPDTPACQDSPAEDLGTVHSAPGQLPSSNATHDESSSPAGSPISGIKGAEESLFTPEETAHGKPDPSYPPDSTMPAFACPFCGGHITEATCSLCPSCGNEFLPEDLVSLLDAPPNINKEARKFTEEMRRQEEARLEAQEQAKRRAFLEREASRISAERDRERRLKLECQEVEEQEYPERFWKDEVWEQEEEIEKENQEKTWDDECGF